MIELLRAEAVESYPRWPNLASYVTSGHEIALAMEWARDVAPRDHALLLVLDLLDAEHDSPSRRLLSVIERRVLSLYHAAIAARAGVNAPSSATVKPILDTLDRARGLRRAA